MNYISVLNNVIKTIYFENPNTIKLSSDCAIKKFELDYQVSEKVAKIMGTYYYFGTDLKYSNEKEFYSTFKELLKVKRALKTLKKTS